MDKADKWRDRDINEADTKALFIEPMLGALGWDIHDLDAVNREYRVYDGTKLDYALKAGNKPRLFIEAKPLLKTLDERQFIAQTVNYANNEGVVWCVLTNGLQYRVYKSNEPAEMERKLLFEVNVEDARNEARAEEITTLLSYLSRESIESGRLDEWGEATFTDLRVKAALDALLANPPIRFVNLIMERLGAEPAPPREKVKQSLRRMARAPSPGWRPAKPPPHTPPRGARVSEVDTVVVPARKDGFAETFIGENRWHAVRIHSSMIPHIKYIAAYRVAPTSAITHWAPVRSIERWKETRKVVVNFAGSAQEIGPIPLAGGGRVKAPQSLRYTTFERLKDAKTLDDVFGTRE